MYKSKAHMAIDMSVRPTPRNNNNNNSNNNNSAPLAQTPIGFKSEFINSPAALQANHEETMGKLLSRLDQLQAKVCEGDEKSGGGGGRNASVSRVSSVFKTKPLPGSSSSSNNNNFNDHIDLYERYTYMFEFIVLLL